MFLSLELPKTRLYLHYLYFQLREEKLQEEKPSEDQIHKLLPEDTETGKRKMDEQKKRDEPLVLKTNPERVSKSPF